MIIGSFYPTAKHRRPKIAKQQTRLRHPNHRITDNGHYVCGFTRNDDGDYQADAETIAWWQAKADEYQEMYELIDERVQQILNDAQGYEFNDYPSYVISELKAI